MSELKHVKLEPVNCCLDGFPAISAQQFNKQAVWAGQINGGLVNFKLCVWSDKAGQHMYYMCI